MISISSKCGRKRAVLATISRVARVNSETISSHILPSLPFIPYFQEIRFEPLKSQAEVLDVSFDILGRCVTILKQERIGLASIQRRKRLDNMIGAHDFLMVSSRELIDCPDP